MKRISTFTGAGIAAVAMGVSVLGGATAASAHPVGHTQNQDQRGSKVTGAAAEQAIAAALAAVPGTADHAHAATDGGYQVKVETATGKTIVVTLDANFAVTAQKEIRGKGAVSPQERAQASDAALVAVPGGTVLEVRKAKDGGFRVIVRTTEGVKRLVTLDASYGVTSVQNAPKGKGRGHGRHGKNTEVTGAAFKKAQTAALSAVPGATVVDVHQQGSVYHVIVTSPDGTKTCVTLDADFQVTATKTFEVKTRS